MRRVLIFLILIVLVVVPGAIFLNGTSVLIVKNEIGADANVTVFFGAQPVGSSRIEKGDSDFYIFTPHQDGAFAIGCRKDTQSAIRTAHVGYAPDTARIFRVRLSACGHASHYGET